LGDEDLLDLPARRLLGTDAVVVVPDELLGDRGAAVFVAAGHVVDGGAQDTGRRDAALGPEALVLRGDHRVLQRLRNLLEGEVLPVVLTDRAEDRLAVGVVHGRVLVRRGRERGGDRRAARHVLVNAEYGEHEHHEHAADEDARLLPCPVPPPVARALDVRPLRPSRTTGPHRTTRPTWATWPTRT